MENFWVMLQTQAELLVYLCIGFYVQKAGIIRGEIRTRFVDYLLKVTLPCMVFSSFDLDMDMQKFTAAATVMGVSFCVYFFSIFIGKLVWRKSPEDKAPVLRYGTLISNSGFAGIPMMESAYGGLGLFYASIYAIPARIFMWTAGISLFARGEKINRTREILLNPCMIAVYFGVFRMLFFPELPEFIDYPIKSVGGTTASLSMVIVGSILAEVPLRRLLDKNAFLLAAVRLAVLPAITLLSLKLMHLDNVALATAVTMTGMPVGTTTSLLAEKYGANYEFASTCTFVTTVLSVFTVPILAFFI